MSGNRPADVSTVTNAIGSFVQIDGIDPNLPFETPNYKRFSMTAFAQSGKSECLGRRS